MLQWSIEKFETAQTRNSDTTFRFDAVVTERTKLMKTAKKYCMQNGINLENAC